MQDHEIEKLKIEMETNARINRIFSLNEDDKEITGLYVCWIFAVIVTSLK